MPRHLSPVLALFAGILSLGATAKTESFDSEPNWDALNNRVKIEDPKTVHQDFGFRATNFAGKEKGEIGGTIWRASASASYADKIPSRTLNDKLTATGTFAFTETRGSSGAFIGFFKSDTPEAGRQGSLGMRFAGEGSGARITLQLVTGTNQACGTKVTPWTVDKSKPVGQGRKVRPTSIRNDGTRYTWKLDYDPAGNNGGGRITFTIRSNRDQHEEWEDRTHTVDLPPGYKDHGTTFDRFGIATSARPGNWLTLYVDDLSYDDKTTDFTTDPQWLGVGNDAKYVRNEEGGHHDFGFSDTHFAGGKSKGELGGTILRSGDYAFYADRTEPLSLEHRLEASGKVILNVGPPDSGMNIGWFNSAERELSPPQAGNFVGVRIGGPTRVGHYFVPAYATAQSHKPDRGDKQHPPNVAVEKGQGPVLVPQKVFDFKLVYDPTANNNQGAITATLGDESVTLDLKPGHKRKGATFDRFGLFTTNRGGSFVRIYLDDLAYTK